MKFDPVLYDKLMQGIDRPSLRQIVAAVKRAGGKPGGVKEKVDETFDYRTQPAKKVVHVEQILEVFDGDDVLEAIPVEHVRVKTEIR